MKVTRSMHYTRMRQKTKTRITGVLFLLAAVLINLGVFAEARGDESLPVVGILSLFGRSDDATWNAFWMQPFRRYLADRGWIEGSNVAFAYRSAHEDPSQFSTAAEELVDLNVDVIMAESAPALRAAFTATRTTPIVGVDLTTEPIFEGYIDSYGRPGGNVTGLFLDAPEFAGKWFELLQAVIPNLSRVAVLWDPAPGDTHLRAVRHVAALMNIKLQVLQVRQPADIDTAFTAIKKGTQAVIILPSPMTYWQNPRLAELGLKYRLPATSMALEFAGAGGAIAYGPHRLSMVERLAVLVGKILDGASPGDVPIERPSKIQLVVNLKTAKALGITIPQSILIRADEVIE